MIHLVSLFQMLRTKEANGGTHEPTDYHSHNRRKASSWSCTLKFRPAMQFRRMLSKSKESYVCVHHVSCCHCIAACLLLCRDRDPTEAAWRGRIFSHADVVYKDLVFAYQFVKPNVKLLYKATGSTGSRRRIMVMKSQRH